MDALEYLRYIYIYIYMLKSLEKEFEKYKVDLVFLAYILFLVFMLVGMRYIAH